MAKLPHSAVQIAELAQDAWFVSWQVATMGAICAAESGRDAYESNTVHAPDKPWHRSQDIGLWQINTWFNPTHAVADLFDPAYNARTAFAIWTDAGGLRTNPVTGRPFGYERWNVYKTGAYKPHLAAAIEAARQVGAL